MITIERDAEKLTAPEIVLAAGGVAALAEIDSSDMKFSDALAEYLYGDDFPDETAGEVDRHGISFSLFEDLDDDGGFAILGHYEGGRVEVEDYGSDGLYERGESADAWEYFADQIEDLEKTVRAEELGFAPCYHSPGYGYSGYHFEVKVNTYDAANRAAELVAEAVPSATPEEVEAAVEDRIRLDLSFWWDNDDEGSPVKGRLFSCGRSGGYVYFDDLASVGDLEEVADYFTGSVKWFESKEYADTVADLAADDLAYTIGEREAERCKACGHSPVEVPTGPAY